MSLALDQSLYDGLKDAVARYVPAAMITVVRGEPLGAKLLSLPDGTRGSLGDPELDGQARAVGLELLGSERSETRTITWLGNEIDIFVETFPPPPTLLIFGAVHVAQSLTRLARQLGFRVAISDARAKLASEERFPEADEVVVEWPEDAFARLHIEPNTYIAILTHDPKFDQPALIGALASSARYIGAVGSRKTSLDRRQRLLDAGVSEESIARVHGPIGLDIGANTPEEMAISILAEIIAVRHGRTGAPLTQTAGNIRGVE